jgi:hypothetical protein
MHRNEKTTHLMKNQILNIIVSSCLMFAASAGEVRDERFRELKIEGAKLSTEIGVRKFAFQKFIERMKAKVSAQEGVSAVSIVVLGFNVPDFAQQGERVWEVRISQLEGQLRAILWIHPQTEKVYELIGPWEKVPPIAPQP